MLYLFRDVNYIWYKSSEFIHTLIHTHIYIIYNIYVIHIIIQYTYMIIYVCCGIISFYSNARPKKKKTCFQDGII